MTPHSFEFLDEPFTSAFEPPAPVNVFTVAGCSRLESVTSKVLAFLLDPNERHGFGTTFVDALFLLIADATTADGRPFAADDHRGSSEWSVAIEACAHDRTRIDILLENDVLDVAIVVENKVDATIANPFGTYVAHAARSHGTVVAAVLAPTHRELASVATPGIPWLRYDDLFDAADAALYDTGPIADQRSLELYAQFRETMSERIATMTIEHEQQRLDELWAAIEHRQEQVLDFFTTLDSVNAVLVARGTRLQQLIGDRLNAAGIEHSSWIVSAGDHAWGRGRGERVLVYLGLTARTGGTVELLIGWLPRTGTFGYAVKAYQARHRPSRPWDHIPLGLPFDADEDAVADRFAQLTLRFTSGERPD